jgi:hypothetical protein
MRLYSVSQGCRWSGLQFGRSGVPLGTDGAVQHGSTATHPDAGGLAGTQEDGDLHGWTPVDVLPPDGMQEVSGSSPLSSTQVRYRIRTISLRGGAPGSALGSTGSASPPLDASLTNASEEKTRARNARRRRVSEAISRQHLCPRAPCSVSSPAPEATSYRPRVGRWAAEFLLTEDLRDLSCAWSSLSVGTGDSCPTEETASQNRASSASQQSRRLSGVTCR